ncbi:MAG: hypothetical protein JWM56_187 [Candidatus Peribacteria bacterium]|nr:hypothetical protein [Candidatus Peribacteria bacterium]
MLENTLFKRHLESDELISRVVHRHWLVGAKYILWPTVSIFIAWFLFFLTFARPVLMLALVWTAGSSIWLLRNFFDYYLDAWIITNKGVIDLAWYGWFHRQSTRVLYSDIQGVSYEIQGLTSTLLHYGTISIEKISTGAAISLAQVPKPPEVEALILKNMESYMHARNLKNSKHVQELLSTFIADQLNTQSMKKAAVEVADTNKETTAKKPTKPRRKLFSRKQA